MDGAASGVSAGTIAIGNALWDMAKTAASAVGDFLKSTAQIGMSFDSSMANVAAISGATGDDFDALREKAMEMGATTVFSASEAADAMGYMAMAGWKTEEMLGGIDGIMNLAAASGEDLATTSDIVTDALTAFGMTAEDSGRFADVLAAASSNANTNVSLMGETFKYVGALAGTMNYSVEDMASAIGLMANAGIKGSQAGTALRAAISSLLSPSDDAASLMNELGISLTDASGEILSFSALTDQLRSAFSGLSESEQAAAAATLFGREAMSGMLAIINAAPEDVAKLTEAVANADGAAQEMAGIMTDNVGGALTMMQSAIEGLKITLFDTFSGDMQSGIETFADSISRVTAAFSEGGLPEAAEEVKTIIGELVSALSVNLEESGGLGQAISGVISAAQQLGSAFDETLPEIISSVSTAVGDLMSALGVEVDIGDIASSVGEFLANFVESIPETIDKVSTAVQKFIGGFQQTGAGEAIGKLGDALKKLFEPFSDAIGDIIGKVAENWETLAEDLGILSGATIEEIADAITELVDEFDRWLPLIVGIVAAFATFKTITAIVSGFTALKAAIEGLTVSQGLLNAVMNLNPFAAIASLVIGLVAVLVTLWNTNDGFREACISAWEAVKSAISTAVDAIVGFFTNDIPQAFNNLLSLFSNIGDKFKEIGSNIVNGIKDGISSAWNTLTSFVDGKIKSLTQGVKDFFGIKSPSKLMRDEVGRWLPPGIAEGFDATFGAAENDILGHMDGLMEKVGRVDFSKSALGIHGASVNSTSMLTAGQNQPQTPVKLYIDGREIAAVMYQPLIDEGKRSGIPLYAR